MATIHAVLQLNPACDVCRGLRDLRPEMVNNTTAEDHLTNFTLNCPDDSLCFTSSNAENIPLAFGLTVAAGLATVVGAVPPLIPCVKHTNRKLLSGSLAMAAGVMIYVSFTEIFFKADAYFCCLTESHRMLSTVCCFFGGIVLTVMINSVVHGLESLDRRYDFKLLLRRALCKCRRHRVSKRMACSKQIAEQPSVSVDIKVIAEHPQLHEQQHTLSVLSEQGAVGGIPASSLDAKVDDTIIETLDCEENDTIKHVADTEECQSSNDQQRSMPSISDQDFEVSVTASNSDTTVGESFEESLDMEETDTVRQLADIKDLKQLRRMGILSCIAIGIHNLPEGLATFVATTADPTFGVALALAIGLHNIPEGLTVAMPIFYATKSRWKAFLFATVSGLAEPIGAFIGWLTLKDSFGPLVYALSFGLVAGMMIYISMAELLRLSYKFDSKGRIATVSLMVGMFIMAIGLLLFQY